MCRIPTGGWFFRVEGRPVSGTLATMIIIKESDDDDNDGGCDGFC